MASDEPTVKRIGRYEVPIEDGTIRATHLRGIKVDDDDFGLLSIDPTGPGLAVSQFTDVFYGALIILFLLFEPLGLYGIWTKIRNYWKGWPFTY